MSRVHNATAKLEGESFFWASLDGEHFLPVSRPVTDDDVADVERLFDGDGNFRPMTFTRRFLAALEGIEFEEREES